MRWFCICVRVQTYLAAGFNVSVHSGIVLFAALEVSERNLAVGRIVRSCKAREFGPVRVWSPRRRHSEVARNKDDPVNFPLGRRRFRARYWGRGTSLYYVTVDRGSRCGCECSLPQRYLEIVSKRFEPTLDVVVVCLGWVPHLGRIPHSR